MKDLDYIYPPLAILLGLLFLIIFLILVFRSQIAETIDNVIEKVNDYFAMRRHIRRERNKYKALREYSKQDVKDTAKSLVRN